MNPVTGVNFLPKEEIEAAAPWVRQVLLSFYRDYDYFPLGETPKPRRPKKSAPKKVAAKALVESVGRKHRGRQPIRRPSQDTMEYLFDTLTAIAGGNQPEPQVKAGWEMKGSYARRDVRHIVEGAWIIHRHKVHGVSCRALANELGYVNQKVGRIFNRCLLFLPE